MSVVEDLGGERGEILLGAAQEAFAQGMQAAALVAAVVALGTALWPLSSCDARGRNLRPSQACPPLQLVMKLAR